MHKLGWITILLIIALAVAGCGQQEPANQAVSTAVPLSSQANKDPNLPMLSELSTRIKVDPSLVEVADPAPAQADKQDGKGNVKGVPSPYPVTITMMRNLYSTLQEQTVAPTPGGMPAGLLVWRLPATVAVKAEIKTTNSKVKTKTKTQQKVAVAEPAGDIIVILYANSKEAALAQGVLRSYGLLDDKVIAIQNVLLLHPDPTQTGNLVQQWPALQENINKAFPL